MSVENAFTFDDVLLVPAYNHFASRKMVSTAVTDQTGQLSLELPVMTANMDTITEDGMANFMSEKGGIGVLHRFMSIDDNVAMYKRCTGKVVVSIGCTDADFDRAAALYDAGATYFCVDVAHGHAQYVGKTLKRFREKLKDVCVIAGNVATYAGADYLASCGADIIKVGIGGGSVCSTRIKTGYGVPTLFSVQECSRVDRSIIADGGLRTSGDIVKALAFGADFVMVGGMFAGTEHTPGKVVEKSDGSKVKMYRGMASAEVQEDYVGHMPDWKTAEGVATEVPYREAAESIMADIIGGLRSGLTYGGAADVKALQRKMHYVKVTAAGRHESLPHKLL